MSAYQIEFVWFGNTLSETIFVYDVNTRAEAIEAVKRRYGKTVRIKNIRQHKVEEKMIQRYANEEEIVNMLSDYKKGDVITLTKDKPVDKRLIKSGTRMNIRQIKLKHEVRILADELDNYEKNNDNFFYLASVSDYEDGFLNSYEFILYSWEFEKGDYSVEEIHNILEKRRKKQIKRNVLNMLFICSLFSLFALVITHIENATSGPVARSIGVFSLIFIVLATIIFSTILWEENEEVFSGNEEISFKKRIKEKRKW